MKYLASALILLLPGIASADALVASHRGSVNEAPENTLAAFRWAESVGADLVEADLRVAKDGSLVVIHDPRVNRTTNGRGKVRKLPLDELKSLDAGKGQLIPTLEEMLAFIRSSEIQLLLDVKDSKRVDAGQLAQALDRHEVEDQVLIGSRSKSLVRALKVAAPELQVLAMVPSTRAVDDYLALDVDAVRLWARWARQKPDLVRQIRRSGAEVWLTTGGLKGQRLEAAVRLADGVITNHPSAALSLTE